LSQKIGVSFPTVFKLPMLLADAVACWLLHQIVARRAGTISGWVSAGVYAIAPISILITAHHCNTEPLYVMLALAAALATDRGRPLLAGLLLGAAINVKLVPVLLIPTFVAMRVAPETNCSGLRWVLRSWLSRRWRYRANSSFICCFRRIVVDTISSYGASAVYEIGSTYLV
jgi:Gpi18-like mannosyltransferase